MKWYAVVLFLLLCTHIWCADVSESTKECFTIEFGGRMGNLMFEYATLVGVCTARKQEYRTCAYLSIPKWTFWPVNEFVSEFNLSWTPTPSCQITQQIAVSESSFAYDPKVMEVPTNGVIKGYVQSWKYFHPHAANLVRQIFTVPSAAAKEAEFFIMNIRDELPTDYTLIAVHVRVGDKIHDPQFLHRYDQWSLSEQYYKKAITLLQRRHPHSALVIFSGGGETKEELRKDREWTKDRFGKLSEHIYFDESENHFASLKAIGLCDAVVIAHSTFSWWAAYLSSTLEVVAPYHYFTPQIEAEKKFTIEDFHLPWWSVISQNASEDRIVGWNPLVEAIP